MEREKSRTILLVEDEPLIALAEKMMLERNGYVVLTADTGERAVELACSSPDIDLVLMDIDLGPGISGTKAAKTILAMRDLPLAFLSSHTESSVVDLTEGITSYGYIVKNSGETVLLASIRMAFRLYEANRSIAVQMMHMSAVNERQRVSDQQLAWWPALMEYVIGNDLTAIAILDRGLNFMYVSRRFLRDYNLAEETVAGRHHYEVFPDIPQRWRDVHQKVLAGETVRSEDDYFERADGSVDYTRWECRPWYEADGAIGGIILYTEVITELRYVEMEHRRLFDSISQGIIYQEADGRISTANPAAQKILGLALDQMQGRSSMDPQWRMMLENGSPVSGEDHPAMIALRTGKTVGPVVRGVYHPGKGEHIWLRITAIPLFLNEESAPFRTYALFEDITAQRLAQEASRASEKQYRQLFESITDAIIVVDRGRQILDCNPAFTRLFGYSREEVQGRSTAMILQRPHEFRRIGEEMARRSAEDSFFLEVPYRRKNGESFTGEKRVQYLRDGEDRIDGFIGIIRDITHRKAAEAEMVRLVREKETMLKEVQHRIKNTMNTMVSLLALQAEAQKDPDAAAALHDAGGRFKSMEVLYDQLYRTEMHDSGSAGDYLTSLVERVVDLFPGGAAVQVSLEVEELVLDARRLAPLGMIATELVTNAMKYAFVGSVTTDPGTRTRTESGASRLCVSLKSTGETAVLMVEDNGPGLPADFDVDTGRGFGLAMVHALAGQLNGMVRLESDQGTRATLEFALR